MAGSKAEATAEVENTVERRQHPPLNRGNPYECRQSVTVNDCDVKTLDLSP